MRTIQRRCMERGDEGDLIFIDFQVVVNRIWRGEFAEARRVAHEAIELTRQLGGEFPVMLGLVIAACVAVYAGSEDDARPAVADAIDASKRSGTPWHEEWALTMLGFLETSLGNYEAALNALEPLLARFALTPDTAEIFAASFVPDAVEALVELGRVAEAEPLVGCSRTKRAATGPGWMLAVGARCRAMVLAAKGDLAAALAAAHLAMDHHDRLPMPFERARTLLTAGSITASPARPECLDVVAQRADCLRATRHPVVGRPRTCPAGRRRRSARANRANSPTPSDASRSWRLRA